MTAAAPFALDAQSISVAYRDTPVLTGASVRIPENTVTGIVGPNGAGKSTLLKAVLGLIPTLTGSVSYWGEPLAQVRRRVGYMPQSASVDWDFPATVADVVLMGTYASLRWGRRPDRRARTAARTALEAVGMDDFASRQIGELSGGQKQRVFLARVLAQDPDLYVMDEPFAGIDAVSERAIMRVLRRLKDDGHTLVLVHHDLSTLRRVCDRVVLLNKETIAQGDVETVLTADALRATYGGPEMNWALDGGDGGADDRDAR
ncbi:metal ABC transporter ATP-binding protein [Actinomyces sp. B33]|uniref:metal ABC transporter ATP-binding protein n=1 Tax=Actinomyces sp. B33 TaxID=2942131 RepID=UPI0023402BA8|nr:metal ABC transporter ATP-binding protein [Actinomyces sp. B33]MDC4232772.1 metal ABC transporter ATP-binding protein [Actinomyces sp. B33]